LKRSISIIGGGASALMLGCSLDRKKFNVCIYEKNAAPGRKFLVAGDGGLNLTHSEAPEKFSERYTPDSFLANAFHHFSNHDFINWLRAHDIPTYTGSSGRVFPQKGIKPIEVLNRLLEHVKNNDVQWQLKHEWLGFSENGELLFNNNEQQLSVKSDYVIFCLGGASWPVTGSTGNWADHFREKNIQVHPFEASNCAFRVEWTEALLAKAEGKALKNIHLSCSDKTHAGEVVITRFGLEGSGIYPLSPQIRQQLHAQQQATIHLDLKPSVSRDSLVKKLRDKKIKTNYTAHIKEQLHLNEVQLTLLKHLVSKEDFLNAELLCKHIKHLPIAVSGTGPVDEAISTIGGIALSETDAQFQLKKMPRHFIVGEMLDYDAPTGGYLLQSCFSMAKFLADHLNLL